MSKDLIPIDRKNDALTILSRAAEDGLMEFKTIGPPQIQKIAEFMPEVHRAMNNFGRKNSQTTNKMMTLNMISYGPYRQLRQCLAQIENRQSAIKENTFKIKKEQVEVARLQHKLKHQEYTDEFEKEEMELELVEKQMSIGDASIYMEGALKELASFQHAYKQICEAHNIPIGEWNEHDFELAEIAEHVKTAFEHSHRDVIQTGRLNMGTMEYLQQFGITPETATMEVAAYLDGEKYNKGDINDLYRWLDDMLERYGEEYKKVMDRMGLKELLDADFLYKEVV